MSSEVGPDSVDSVHYSVHHEGIVTQLLKETSLPLLPLRTSHLGCLLWTSEHELTDRMGDNWTTASCWCNVVWKADRNSCILFRRLWRPIRHWQQPAILSALVPQVYLNLKGNNLGQYEERKPANLAFSVPKVRRNNKAIKRCEWIQSVICGEKLWKFYVKHNAISPTAARSDGNKLKKGPAN